MLPSESASVQWGLVPARIKPWPLHLAFVVLLCLMTPSFQTHLSLVTFLYFMPWPIWANCPPPNIPKQVPVTCWDCLLNIEFSTSASLSVSTLSFLSERARMCSPAWWNSSRSEFRQGLVCLLLYYTFPSLQGYLSMCPSFSLNYKLLVEIKAYMPFIPESPAELRIKALGKYSLNE